MFIVRMNMIVRMTVSRRVNPWPSGLALPKRLREGDAGGLALDQEESILDLDQEEPIHDPHQEEPILTCANAV